MGVRTTRSPQNTNYKNNRVSKLGVMLRPCIKNTNGKLVAIVKRNEVQVELCIARGHIHILVDGYGMCNLHVIFSILAH